MCTTIYKCIAKILAKTLKDVLPHLVSLTQIAFVKGRTISDNVFFAYELEYNYHKLGVSPRISIKIYLYEAFDSLDWRSTLNFLTAAGFPPMFIGRI